MTVAGRSVVGAGASVVGGSVGSGLAASVLSVPVEVLVAVGVSAGAEDAAGGARRAALRRSGARAPGEDERGCRDEGYRERDSHPSRLSEPPCTRIRPEVDDTGVGAAASPRHEWQDRLMDPRAGTLALPEDLIDVDAVVGAYYDLTPDVDDPAQKVVFGTSGHRGSSLDHAFNEAHIIATTAAIVEYRRAQGTDGPLFIGRDTHALSSRRGRPPSRCSARRASRCYVDARDSFTPTPAVSHAILLHNGASTAQGVRTTGPGLADGIVVTPSHNPPRDGGFKYNPPHGGPAGSEATSWIADRANEILRSGVGAVRRVSLDDALAAEPRTATTTSSPTSTTSRRSSTSTRSATRACGSAPTRSAARRRVLGRDRRALQARPHGREPAGRPALGLHDPRLGREDPHGLLLALRHGLARQGHGGRRPLRHRDRQRRGLRPPRHRHARRRADEPEPLPRRGDQLPVRRSAPGLAAGRGDRQDPRVVALIDRVAGSLGRRLDEVPVGFKWFVPGLLNGSVGFGGEESAGASFLRKDGSVWTTDKDGIILALLASEIQATTGKSPSQHHAALVEQHGQSWYARVDAPATLEEKATLSKLSADQVTATTLAGEQITAKLTEAPSNGAAIGGLKVTTENALVRRPSLGHRERVQDLRRVLHLPRAPRRGAGGREGSGRRGARLTALTRWTRPTGRTRRRRCPPHVEGTGVCAVSGRRRASLTAARTHPPSPSEHADLRIASSRT